ncbi:MAG: glycoside hydrolase family 16 protein [Flavobacteriales bacterium]|jgi:beta-glucanase (GH16 family)|nr:glycoside hydrolase family 16 protein [Flavobacteriales bacterium]
MLYKINSNILCSALSIFGLLIISCCKPEPQLEAVLPTNLEVTIDILDDGIVQVEASATNANFYTITFFENSNDIEFESTDGIANHSFSASGTYSILIKAHTTYADYIEESKSISIDLDGQTPISDGYTTPLSYPGYTLVWSDEFEGTALSSDWTYDLGTGDWGWGNNELQYYRQNNAVVDQGLLVITAKEEIVNSNNYTSARIKTQGLKSFQYGRVDVRAKLPKGKGIWPALWMLGDNISSASWPNCGEIDIMEMIGGGVSNEKTIYGTLHWDDNGSHASYGGNNSLNSGIFADEFHVFSIIWNSSSIEFLRDDIQYHIADITPTQLSEFHQNFFLIFNVAVGGNWPGNPDGTTDFPQSMYVDYIRVFQ